MTHSTIERSPRTPAVWLGTLWLLAVTLGGAMTRRALDPGGALVVASVYALGTFGMAWITMRGTAYPFTSWGSTAGVMSLALLVVAALFPDPADMKELTATAWMFPALFLFVGLTRSPSRGWCAPNTRSGRWALFGIGCVYSLILLGAAWMSRAR